MNVHRDDKKNPLAVGPTTCQRDDSTPEEKKETYAGNSENATYQKLIEQMKNEEGVQLDVLAKNVMHAIITPLKQKQGETVDAIKQFLFEGSNEPKKSADPKIDDCFLWHLLLEAVDIDKAERQKDKDLNAIEARVELSKIILQKKPYLAYENPSQDYSNDRQTTDGYEMIDDYERQCTDDKKHANRGEPYTPFYKATSCGNHVVIAAMIEHGKLFYEAGQPSNQSSLRQEFSETKEYWPLHKILQQQNVSGNAYGSILKLATQAKRRNLKTLEELLKVEGIHICEHDRNHLDRTFEHAIDIGDFAIVERFLGRDELAKVYVTHRNIDLAVEMLKSVQGDPHVGRGEKVKIKGIYDHRSKIAQELVKRVTQSETLDRKLMEKIITVGLKDVWDLIPKDMLAENLKACLLHLAVCHQKYEFVNIFLDEYPDSVTKRQAINGAGEGYFPLWYNNQVSQTTDPGEKDPSTRRKIRDALVKKMIHETPEIETLTQIFHTSNEPVGELGFDMLWINSANYRVSDVVDSLLWQSRKQWVLTYEETLRYAEFPPLDIMLEERETFAENSHLTQEHDEVFRILKWLGKRNVKTIIKLRVSDRLINPHDEIRMAKVVDNFKVEILDWKVLDLPLSVLKPDTKKRLKELHLYASGNRATISHWFSNEGISTLKNLEQLEIKIVKETCTSKRFKLLRKEIGEKFDEFKESLKPEPKAEHQSCPRLGRVDLIPWYPTQKLADLNEITRRVAPKLAHWLPELKSIVANKKRTKGFTFRPTRVAILDNGILSISPVSHRVEEEDSENENEKESSKLVVDKNGVVDKHDSQKRAGEDIDRSEEDRSLSKRIKEGRSFVDGDSRQSSWLFASDPHGTQMANLICAIDPFCEIYVARVAEGASGISVNRVAQAIDWARDKAVDVISMSFIIREPPGNVTKLDEAVKNATSAGIMMTCSAHDEGAKIEDAYPLDLHTKQNSLLALAACDDYGKILRDEGADGAKHDFLIPGKDVAAGVIPFLKSEDTITGSSVSTAIGAGLSSLILTCDRLQDPNKKYNGGIGGGSRFHRVKEVLGTMGAPGNPKFLLLDKFHGIAEIARKAA